MNLHAVFQAYISANVVFLRRRQEKNYRLFLEYHNSQNTYGHTVLAQIFKNIKGTITSVLIATQKMKCCILLLEQNPVLCLRGVAYSPNVLFEDIGLN